MRVPSENLTQAYNGVDTTLFAPHPLRTQAIDGCPFDPSRHWLVGTVGRMQTAKDQVMLARALVQALQMAPELRERLRLVMIGEGPLRAQVQTVLDAAGVANLAWLPGERSDIPHVLRGLHAFALPSLAEGISNTILEAMACALPVVATAVGGNADLVDHGQTGYVVAPAIPQEMALRLVELARAPELARSMGQVGCARVKDKFSLPAMVGTYHAVYDQALRQSPTSRDNH